MYRLQYKFVPCEAQSVSTLIAGAISVDIPHRLPATPRCPVMLGSVICVDVVSDTWAIFNILWPSFESRVAEQGLVLQTTFSVI